jgi:DNA polymerase III alpha subunit (gram-positive type)
LFAWPSSHACHIPRLQLVDQDDHKTILDGVLSDKTKTKVVVQKDPKLSDYTSSFVIKASSANVQSEVDGLQLPPGEAEQVKQMARKFIVDYHEGRKKEPVAMAGGGGGGGGGAEEAKGHEPKKGDHDPKQKNPKQQNQQNSQQQQQQLAREQKELKKQQQREQQQANTQNKEHKAHESNKQQQKSNKQEPSERSGNPPKKQKTSDASISVPPALVAAGAPGFPIPQPHISIPSRSSSRLGCSRWRARAMLSDVPVMIHHAHYGSRS